VKLSAVPIVAVVVAALVIFGAWLTVSVKVWAVLVPAGVAPVANEPSAGLG
jgi:hypothetical protein